jgi:cytochrome c-type biogenesis protein CcmF
MLVAAVLVSYFTLASAFPSWMPLGGQSFGPATYDSMARPVGILYVFIMAVCPILSWKKTDGATFWKRVKWPLAGAAVLGAILMYIWATQLWPIGLENDPGAGPLNSVDFWWSILGLLVASLAIAIPVYLFIDGARKRSAARDEGFFTALFGIFSKARSQSGGYLTHLGIGIILVGLVGSAMFVLDIRETVPPTPGTTFEAAGYTFTFVEVGESTRPNGDVDTISVFDVSKGGSSKGTIQPSILFHSTQGQTTRNVDIIYEPLRDVFIIFEGTNDDGSLSMNLKVNPLISFAWVGFLFTIIGTTIAVWPKKQPAAA